MNKPAFTSMLSVDGAACARYHRLQPVADVMGVWVGGPTQYGLSENPWDTVLWRIAREARDRGAQAVIGIRLETRRLDEQYLEYLAFGTAVQFTDGTATGGLVLTSMLPMDQTVSLLEAGFLPTHVLSASVGERFWNTGALGMSSRNFELVEASRAYAAGRRWVHDRIHSEAARRGCSGVLGMRFDTYLSVDPLRNTALVVNTWGFAQGIAPFVRGGGVPRTIDLTPRPVVSLRSDGL
ncbi:heavy metal-binding domain-containing protein [Tsukamurella soli]|uniref:Heavy-metal-binding n=1 Tax=Tsukamurella soli TaxID=644556 RepID=A0ABP8J1M6_9ACTN